MRRATLSLMLITVVALAANANAQTTKTTDSPKARLDRAKSAFIASVGEATTQLAREYEDVAQNLATAGDADAAADVRAERDRFLFSTTRPAVEGRALAEAGWTVLFRSKDPLLWNVEVNNAESYALPVQAAPATMKYLRIRRLDTNEAVIIETRRDGLDKWTWPSDKPFFRGDKRLNRQACAIGVIDPSHASDRSAPLLASTPEGWFSGWGFAEAGENDAGRQEWVWDHHEIPPTVMEISVAPGPLSAEEHKHLLESAKPTVPTPSG